MRLLFQSDTADPELWSAALKAEMPELDIRVWPETGDPGEIDMMLVYRLPPEGLANYTRLKFIQLISAGADQLRGVSIPDHIAVARLIEPGQISGMVEYVTHAVLHYHRGFHIYQRQQNAGIWREHPRIAASARKVGVIGLGALGAPVACALKQQGFDVCGWSRSQRSIEGIEVFAGSAGMARFLAACEIVVAILPLAPETVGMFDHAFFAAMRPGSCFINVGRGVQVDTDALIRALVSNKLGGATLDVLASEPVPPEHPAWTTPNLRLTPHIATSANAVSAAPEIIANFHKVLQGNFVSNIQGL